MAKKSKFFVNFLSGMLLDLVIFILAMILFINFALSSMGFAYILAIVMVLGLGFAYYIHKRFVARKIRE